MSAHDAEDAASKAIGRPADRRDIDPATLTPVLYAALRQCLMDDAERIDRETSRVLPPAASQDGVRRSCRG